MFNLFHEWEWRRRLDKQLLEVIMRPGSHLDEENELRHKIDCLVDRKRFRSANKYNIKIPQEWIKSTYEDNAKLPRGIMYRFSQSALMFSLTEEGRAELDSIIKQKRRESWEWWVTKVVIPVITGLTGLAGSVIGVLSFLIKK